MAQSDTHSSHASGSTPPLMRVFLKTTRASSPHGRPNCTTAPAGVVTSESVMRYAVEPLPRCAVTVKDISIVQPVNTDEEPPKSASQEPCGDSGRVQKDREGTKEEGELSRLCPAHLKSREAPNSACEAYHLYSDAIGRAGYHSPHRRHPRVQHSFRAVSRHPHKLLTLM